MHQMLSDVIQTPKYETATKEIAISFTHLNTFIHLKFLIPESYLGPRRHLSWNSLWRKLTTESH